jgi:hypothetical protein
VLARVCLYGVQIFDDQHPMYRPGPTAINVHPANHLIESLKDLVVEWKWKKLTLVYREDGRIVQLARFFEDTEVADIEVSLIKVWRAEVCVCKCCRLMAMTIYTRHNN